MGQLAHGILYGCEAPKLADEIDNALYANALHGLVGRWEKAQRIPWSYSGLKIRIECEGGETLLGVWVAVGGSGEDGAPDFLEACMPLDLVTDFYSKSIEKAKKLWDRFAAHVAKKEKIVLPAPTLWLTPCEVA